MLWRRAVLGAVGLILAILAAQLGRVSTSAEDQAAVPDRSESQAESSAKTDVDVSAEPARSGEETIEIPLSEIWAWEMPGTHDLGKLGSERENLEPYIWADQIRRELARGLKKDETSAEGFVVMGRGEQALEGAYHVLAEGKKPAKKFPESEELSVVFYSHSSSRYVHLSSVTIKDHQIKIHFELVPHKTKELSCHFAVIPFGNLDVGEYQVSVVRLPLAERYFESGFKSASEEYVRRLISQSFSFTVEK